MPVPASFMSGLNHLGTQVVYGHQQLPGTYAAASSPPGQRLRNLARQEHDAHEAAARASAYGYNPPGSQRPASHRGPAPPKPMQAIMGGPDKELRDAIGENIVVIARRKAILADLLKLLAETDPSQPAAAAATAAPPLTADGSTADAGVYL